MRYFFHAIGTGTSYMDDNGTELENDDAAVAYAFVISNELAADESFHGYEIVVTSKTRTGIGQVPVVSGRGVPRASH